MKYTLNMSKDSSGETYGYSIKDEADNIVLNGDGYKSEDIIITELSELNEALSSIFG